MYTTTTEHKMQKATYTTSAKWIIDTLKGFADMTPAETRGQVLHLKVKANDDLQAIREAAIKYGWTIEWNSNDKSINDKKANFMLEHAASRSMTNIINLYCTKVKAVK
jgi:hypothetical protein